MCLVLHTNSSNEMETQSLVFAGPREITDTSQWNPVWETKKQSNSAGTVQPLLYSSSPLTGLFHSVSPAAPSPDPPKWPNRQWCARSSQKRAETPRLDGRLKGPFPFLPGPWALSSRHRERLNERLINGGQVDIDKATAVSANHPALIDTED